MNVGLDVPLFTPRGTIAFIAQFHVAVASLGIGLAFLVTISQIVGYRTRLRRYDLFAKRTQLLLVCIYNIGTINAIGLVFALNGVFPQFFAQLFVHQFWALILEEFIFLLLATTLTFHYFFWENLWGHKKTHIFLGSLMTPLFLFQFYIINGIGSFMMTPGAFPEGTLNIAQGILGWDRSAFYNPTLLMLNVHRIFANISYGGFWVAGWSGLRLFLTKDPVKREYYESGGRLAFYVAFVSLLCLPVVGFFYSSVLQAHASPAFWALMKGEGDVVKWGVNIWWLKHVFVAIMLGACLGYFSRRNRESTSGFFLPRTLIYAVSALYIVFYLAMGMVMTWAFFFWMMGCGVGAAVLVNVWIRIDKGSERAVFLMMALLAFGTVLAGGWSRESSRPRFVQRHSAFNELYVPEQQQQFLLVDVDRADIPPAPPLAPAVGLIRERCIGCHNLDRLLNYRRDDWGRQVRLMVEYGANLNGEEQKIVIEHLNAGRAY